MDIFLSIRPTANDLSSLFDVELPVNILKDWNDELAGDVGAVHTVILTENQSEFPYGLSFQEQIENQETWLLDSARKLSVTLNCRSLYTGNPLEPNNPFLCIVFDSGQAYLADDLGSILAEGKGGPVNLLRRLPDLDASAA